MLGVEHPQDPSELEGVNARRAVGSDLDTAIEFYWNTQTEEPGADAQLRGEYI